MKLSIPRRYPLSVIFFLLLVFGLALLPMDGWGRAGGGDGFSVGGSGSGGGGGDSEGLFWILYLLVRLIIHAPVIGIPVAVVVGRVAYVGWRSGYFAHQGRTIRRGVGHAGARDQSGASNFACAVPMHVQSGLEAIRQQDPAFSVDILKTRIRSVFLKVQAGWSKQDPQSICLYLSDGLAERFAIQLGMQKSMGIRNAMTGVQVSGVEVLGVRTNEAYESIDLRITAQASDSYVDANTGAPVQGDASVSTFSEVWSCLRRPGVQTLTGPGLFEGNCPNCGQDLPMGQVGHCPGCGSVVRSGEHDWVVAEITQLAMWKGQLEHHIPGLPEMRKADAAFSCVDLEDRVSAMFWRLRAAEFFSDTAYLASVMVPHSALADAWEQRVALDAAGRRRFYSGPAVGSVDVVSVRPSVSDGLDHVHVRVIWSGKAVTALPGVAVLPSYEESQPACHEFELVRTTGTQSRRDGGLSSFHCPGCGGPQESLGLVACAYCGTPLNDPAVEWVLTDVRPFLLYTGAMPGRRGADEDGDGQPDLLPLLTRRDSEKLLRCVVGVMLADGELDARERKLLGKMAQRRGFSDAWVETVIAEVRAEGSVSAPVAGTYEENAEFLRALVVMCLADGKVTREERQLIKALVAHMNYASADISQCIAKERTSAYRAARKELR
jgi:tellurite resistance protein